MLRNRAGLKWKDLHYVDIRLFGSIEVADHTSILNTAVAQVPIGATLFLPRRTYVVSGTGQLVTLDRHINILGDKAIIRVDGADTTTDLFYVQVTDAGGYSDVRGMRIEGIWPFFNGSGRHCILVHAAGTGALPQINPEIRSCLLSAGTAGPAVFVAGDVHSMRLLDNDINDGVEFGSYSGSIVPADGHQITRNLFSGNRMGITLRAQDGSFSHSIDKNVFSARDGAIFTSASQVKIRDNQIEQPASENLGAFNSQVVIVGEDYTSQSCEITGNNFGAGTNVDYAILMSNAKHALIDNNDFNITGTGADIIFGSGADYNRVGPNNRPRGAGRGTFYPTNLTVGDSGVGNYGTWRYISAYGLSNSWASDGFFYKAVDGKVTVESTLTSGTTTGGDLMFTLPVGARPVNAMRVGVETSSGAGYVLVATNGQVTVGSLPSNTVYFNGFTFLAAHEV